MISEKITYNGDFRLSEKSNGIVPKEELNPVMDILMEKAPNSTRNDVNVYSSEHIDDYFLPQSTINSNYGDSSKAVEFDGIRLVHLSPSVLAHELTHAYTAGAFKEGRGYAKLINKINTNPELREKLEPIADKLKEAKKDVKYFANNVYIYNEAIAHAVETEYGELPENPHSVKRNMGACKELIEIIGIDGARSFVKNKLREMYINENEGAPLIEEIGSFQENVIAFYEQNKEMN